MLETPFKMFRKNMVFTKKGEVWAYYAIDAVSINQNNVEELEKYKFAWRNLFMELRKYENFHLQLYPKRFELEKRLEMLEEDFDEEIKAMATYYNDELKNILGEEFGEIMEDKYILGVCLKKQLYLENASFKELLKDGFGGVTKQFINLVKGEIEFTKNEIEQYEFLECELASLVSGVGGFALPKKELVYIARLNFTRGILHDVAEESEREGFMNLTNTLIDPTEKGFLKLENENGSSYMAFVVMNDFPLNMRCNNLFLVLQKLPFFVEAHIKGQYVEMKKAKFKTGLISRRFAESQRETNEVGENSTDRVKQGRYMMDRLSNELDQDIPLIGWLGTLVVTGKTKEECQRNASYLIRFMKKRKVECVRPMADQLQLFYKFLHGSNMSLGSNWIQSTTPKVFGELGFSINAKLGNNVGFYIGRIDETIRVDSFEKAINASKKLFLFHPFIANKGIKGAKTDSPHVAITGETGKGKSFLVKLLFFYLTFLKTKVLYIDPKSELRKWFMKTCENEEIKRKYPWFVQYLKSFNYVTLEKENPNNWGVLDPITYLQGADAKDTAQGVIESIYNMDDKDEVKTAVLKEIDKAIEERQLGEKIGLLHVIERLRNYDDVKIKNAGELLVQLTQNSVLQLVFSHGQNRGLDLDAKVNILEVAGLDLPKEKDDPRYYTDAEKKSLCLMVSLAKFCEKFGSKNPNEETVEIMDEAWMLSSSKLGKKIIKSMRRIGRSFNNALFFVTQSVSDIQSEDDHGNFGVVFAFDEPTEREEILKHLGLEVNKKSIDMLANTVKGQCIVCDIKKNVNKIVVHSPFEEFTMALQTVEKSNSSKAEEMYNI